MPGNKFEKRRKFTSSRLFAFIIFYFVTLFRFNVPMDYLVPSDFPDLEISIIYLSPMDLHPFFSNDPRPWTYAGTLLLCASAISSCSPAPTCCSPRTSPLAFKAVFLLYDCFAFELFLVFVSIIESDCHRLHAIKPSHFRPSSCSDLGYPVWLFCCFLICLRPRIQIRLIAAR